MAFTPDGNHFLYSSWSDYSEYAPGSGTRFHSVSCLEPEASRSASQRGCHALPSENRSQSALISLPFALSLLNFTSVLFPAILRNSCFSSLSSYLQYLWGRRHTHCPGPKVLAFSCQTYQKLPKEGFPGAPLHQELPARWKSALVANFSMWLPESIAHPVSPS